MSKQYLPIGTIVKLNNIEKLVMISGYFPSGESRPGYVWDYSAFSFPEGMIGSNQVVQFDIESVEKIIVMGYQDEEQINFIAKLSDKADEIKSYGRDMMAQMKDSEVTD